MALKCKIFEQYKVAIRARREIPWVCKNPIHVSANFNLARCFKNQRAVRTTDQVDQSFYR